MAEVRLTSCSHGHVVAVVRVSICPKPFVLHRTLRFYEVRLPSPRRSSHCIAICLTVDVYVHGIWQAENTIMRRRIRIVGQVGGSTGAYPGYFPVSQRFVHCVELGLGQDLGQGQGRVVVEWGGEPDLDGDGVGNLEMIVRYRCGPFPEVRVTMQHIHTYMQCIAVRSVDHYRAIIC